MMASVRQDWLLIVSSFTWNGLLFLWILLEDQMPHLLSVWVEMCQHCDIVAQRVTMSCRSCHASLRYSTDTLARLFFLISHTALFILESSSRVPKSCQTSFPHNLMPGRMSAVFLYKMELFAYKYSIYINTSESVLRSPCLKRQSLHIRCSSHFAQAVCWVWCLAMKSTDLLSVTQQAMLRCIVSAGRQNNETHPEAGDRFAQVPPPPLASLVFLFFYPVSFLLMISHSSSKNADPLGMKSSSLVYGWSCDWVASSAHSVLMSLQMWTFVSHHCLVCSPNYSKLLGKICSEWRCCCVVHHTMCRSGEIQIFSLLGYALAYDHARLW